MNARSGLDIRPPRLAGPPGHPSARLATSLAALGRVARGALGILALLPVAAFFVARPPLPLLVMVAALLALSLARPRLGWLALAALVPLGSLLANLSGSRWGLTEPLVLAFLGGWLLRETMTPRDRPAGGRPALPVVYPLALGVLACVAASLAVDLAVLQVSTLFPLDFLRLVFRFLWHDYYLAPGVLPLVPAAAPMVEGLGVFIATVVLTTRTTGLVRAGAQAVAYGASIVAAVNLGEFAQRVASTNWTGVRDVIALRVSYAFPDVNAAGSYFVMALFVAAGLAAADRRRRPLWIAAAVGVLAGLWVSGSRTALLAAPIAGLLAAARALRGRSRASAKAVAGIALVLALIASAYWLASFRAPKRGVEGAVRWRAEMAATAFRMVSAHPLFGVGTGRFHELSYDYSSPEWRTRVPHENAHNNFLQVLAELGVTGFAPFLWLVGAVILASFTGRANPGHEWLVRGCGAGVLAFCLTALGGHPLLIREVAIAFWIVLGLSVGLVADPRIGSSSLPSSVLARVGRVAPWALIVFVVASIPFRVHGEVLASGIERAGMGFSQWHATIEGTRFRWMDREARLFVPSQASFVTLPVRSPGEPVLLRVLVAGKVVARQVVDTTGWHQVGFELRPSSPGSYVAVDLLVGPLRDEAGDAREPRYGDERVQIGMPSSR